jgi:CRISPR type III-B/RAMP module RAMP protein Cmr1
MKDLFEKESVIFGSTEGRSRVSLRVLNTEQELMDLAESGPISFDSKTAEGLKYLFYSCEQRARQPGRQRRIKSNAEIRVEMRLTGTDRQNQEAVMALYFAQTFGGLGLRSRRGGGSFSIVPQDVLPELIFLFDTKAKDVIDASRNPRSSLSLSEWVSLIEPGSPLYQAFTQTGCFKEVPGNGKEKPEDLLNRIGIGMKKYRSIWDHNQGPNTSFRQEARALHSGGSAGSYSGPNPLSKSAFGLPIIYRFKARDPKTGAVLKVVGKSGKIGPQPEAWSIELSPAIDERDRRASPLFISIHQDANGIPYANLLILWDCFLPDQEQIAVTKVSSASGTTTKTSLGTVNPPGVSTLTDFLTNATF